jgi:hypothetical protein
LPPLQTIKPTNMGGVMFRLNRRHCAIALALWLSVTPAQAANWFEMNFWLSGPRHVGRLPACESFWALKTIQRRFAEKESRFWQTRLQITDFEGIEETAFSSWAPDTIPRRFCSAVVLVSDGIRRPVHYAIGEDLGMIGATWGVEWCVVGLDRNWAYNPACRMARP